MESQSKTIIYQVFTRLYGNRNTTRKENGTIADNGCGKLNDFTPTVLKNIRQMGVSHIWEPYLVHRCHPSCHADGLHKLWHPPSAPCHCEG